MTTIIDVTMKDGPQFQDGRISPRKPGESDVVR